LATAITAHHLGYGLVTDTPTRVLDVGGQPMAALFAVDDDAASIFGDSCPCAGATLGPAMTFGYICANYLANSRSR
jgi:3-oxosteroid 1-dehydrogenase